MNLSPSFSYRRRGGLRVLAGAATLALAGARHAAAQQPAAAPYPTRALRVVVPFPPGGYADVLSRLLAPNLGTALGQPVVVENRAGAGGAIGADAVAKAAPDGHTLLVGSIGTQAVNPWLYPHLPYDAARDFAPIAFMADAETVLVVPPALGVKTLADLVALARSRPQGLTYASGGPGTTGHLAGELFQDAVGVRLVHVPYKGNVPALADVVAGQVDLSFATLQQALTFIRGGRLVALATLGNRRSAALPQVPTAAQAGTKGLDVRNWVGLLAPAGTPAPVCERLAGLIDRGMRAPAAQQMLAAQGLAYTPMGPQAFGAFMTEERARWGRVVKAAGVTAG